MAVAILGRTCVVAVAAVSALLLLFEPVIADQPIDSASGSRTLSFAMFFTDEAIKKDGFILPAEVKRLYEGRQFNPFWIRNGELSDDGRSVVELLHSSAAHGLKPEEYHATVISEILAGGDEVPVDQQNRVEALLTDGTLAYARDVSSGRVLADFLDSTVERKAPAETTDFFVVLATLEKEEKVAKALEKLPPRHAMYGALQKALAQYREIDSTGGWEPLPDGPTLKGGSRDARIPQLVQRLAATGDIAAETAAQESYGPEIEAGVRHFQNRHGVKEDGVLGPKTIALLNVSPRVRIRQIEFTLERLRWLPRDLGGRYVEVIIPSYRVRLVDGDKVTLEMEAVVGQAFQSTPMLIGALSKIEVNPNWNIPNDIAVKELLPKVNENPEYLTQHGTEAVLSWDDEKWLSPDTLDWTVDAHGQLPFRLRQLPGPHNPLGKFKFLFPNRLDVYLHDTNERHLFDKDQRTFSHGCIRVERAEDLARALIATGETEGDLDRALSTAARTVLLLSQDIPVYLNYWTAWVDQNGVIHFADDIYKEDKRLEAAFGDPQTRFVSWYQPPTDDTHKEL